MAMFTSKRAPTCPMCYRDHYDKADQIQKAGTGEIKCQCGHTFKSTVWVELSFNNEGVSHESKD